MLLEEMLGAVRQRHALGHFVSPPVSSEEATRSLQPIADAPGVEIRWFGVNEPRADAQITSGDGREWRVVFMTKDAARVHELWVFERPEPFEGVEGGTVIVVNAAVGAGKSTLIELFAETEATPWVVFDDQDHYGRIRTNHRIWLETCGPLYRGFLAGIGAMAAEANQVIMSSVGLPQKMFFEALEGIPAL